MQPHQTRVVQEKEALDTNIGKLADFLVKIIDGNIAVDTAEQDRLAAQLSIMQAYSGILGMRINAFGE